MRKLKVQVQTSIDGFMASEQGDVAWATLPWDPELTSYITDITRSVDTILLGRRLAEGFIPAWAARPGAEDPQAVKFMNQTPRLVLSTSLETSPWPNASIVGGGLDEVAELLNSDGGDVLAYGGGTLVSGLIRSRLVDELHLMINPVAIGAGMPVFAAHGTEQLELLEGRSFTCGITVLTYAAAERDPITERQLIEEVTQQRNNPPRKGLNIHAHLGERIHHPRRRHASTRRARRGHQSRVRPRRLAGSLRRTGLGSRPRRLVQEGSCVAARTQHLREHAKLLAAGHDPDNSVATVLNNAHKYVVSTSLSEDETAWSETTVIGDNILDAIRDLKRRDGEELQIHGSWHLVHTLHEAGLVDVFRILQFPVIVGSGKRLWQDAVPASLQVRHAEMLEGGIASYELHLTEFGSTASGEYAVVDGREAVTEPA